MSPRMKWALLPPPSRISTVLLVFLRLYLRLLYLIMVSPACSKYLCSIASDTWFVLGAYFFAFFPWVVLSNTDYITEKWRTVRRTRVLSWYHVVFSIGPMLYVGVYAEAQRQVEDSKELGAALAALFLNLIHFVRTVWGMAQLNAFVGWCKETMECLLAMQGTDEDNSAPVSEEDRSSEYIINDEDEKPLEELLMVNNSVVDNELGGTDVTVKVSWRKVWEGLKKRELTPLSWLETEDGELCTMRWASAFLCGVGDKWCGEGYLNWSRPAEALSSFFSDEMYFVRHHLSQVTFGVEGEGCRGVLVSVEEDEENADMGQVKAYGYSEPNWYRMERFESYNFESESLRSSYPALEANNREKAVAGLADSVILAKQLGVEKLSMMRRYFDRYRLPTNEIWRKAVYILLEQCRCTPKDDSPLADMFCSLKDVPLPYQLQMVALWDDCTNWRLLQASAHCDIDVQLFRTMLRQKSLFEMEPLPSNVFEYCRRLANTKSSYWRFLGVSMETVRTFLGEWVLSAPDVVDWEPLIPTDSFEFSTSFRFSFLHRREIWDCQRALQSELAKKSTTHVNMPSNAEMIMLFILSMPVFRVDEEEEEDGKSNVTNEIGVVRSGENSDTTSSRAHSSVNVSVNGYRVSSEIAPQDISVVIRFNTETRRVSLKLRHNGTDGRFKWEDWVDAAMGWMKGGYEAEKEGGNEGNIERALGKVDLGKPMLELSPVYCGAGDSSTEGGPFDSDSADSLMETGIVRVWMGWPAFDVRICKFEIDQWLSACNIDINNIEFDRYGYRENRKVDEEIGRAEETIRKVNEVILLDENDERSEKEDNGITEALHRRDM